MHSKTLAWLIEHALQWESHARDLYLKLAQQFLLSPAISGFWLQLSADEAWHLEILREIDAALTPEQLGQPVKPAAEAAVEAVEKLLHRTAQVKLFTLEHAYQLAHELEQAEINAVFRLLAVEYIPDKQRQQFVISQIEEHVERLVRFGRRYPAASRVKIRLQSGPMAFA
jgi:hypothetical protein